MTGSSIRPLGPLAAEVNHPPTDGPSGALAEEVRSANTAAVQHAQRRLSSLLPTAALTVADQYFGEAAAYAWDDGARPGISADELFGLICASPRSVSVSDKAEGLQVEVRTLGEQLQIIDLGDPVEPGSHVAVLLPKRLRGVALGNASIELRQFDRQCRSWAPFADDLSAVTGADVFLKLFVADGKHSVNGWHRDRSDVLVTVIHGGKRFAVAHVEADDDSGEERTVVDTILRPGDALLVPRNRLHNATPAGELSALLSMGLMRVADWPFRQVPPSHLGFRAYPGTAATYRLCLRSHVPPTLPGVAVGDIAPFRTRLPGGMAVLGTDGGRMRFAAAGAVYDADEPAVRALASIHAGEGVDAREVAAQVGLPRSRCSSIVSDLIDEGLVRA